MGKWDAGMATPTHTPAGRGFDTALCYFHHGNSYWVQKTGDMTCPVGVDLWDAHEGAAHPPRPLPVSILDAPSISMGHPSGIY